jgi:ZIP family zinc transporter
MSEVTIVFVYALITAVATALGALPFIFVRELSDRTIAYANAIASGLMLGACYSLVAEGAELGSLQTGGGALLGVGFILLTQRFLDRYEVEFGSLSGAGARRMTLIIVVMTVHSIAEGVAIGASFAGGATLAALITVAIAVHNIPEGLAISAVLRPRGASIAACAWWSFFSSIPQPLVAVPAFLFVDAFQPALPYGMGFAAGAMVFMVLVELLPEAYGEGRRAPVALLVSATLVAMVVFQQYL